MADSSKPAKEARKNGKDKAKKPPADRSVSPVLPQFGSEIMENMANNELIICKICSKNILKNVESTHIAGCLKAKQEKLRKKKAREAAAARNKNKQDKGDGSDEDLSDNNKPLTSTTAKGARKSTNKTAPMGEDGKKSKKRKADAEDFKGPDSKKKKTKKEEAKAKQVPKTKGPVDVEKQCGVQLPNGAKCARSLTCKSHSMGAKRSVPGRSLPYDMLLAAYQKKNQARQQKAAISANAPAVYDSDPDDPSNLPGAIDSDTERDSVMTSLSRCFDPFYIRSVPVYQPPPIINPATSSTNPLPNGSSSSTAINPSSSTFAATTPYFPSGALVRSGPQPLAAKNLFPTRRKYQLVRMKELLGNAMGGNRGAGLFAVVEPGRTAAGGLGTGVAGRGEGGMLAGGGSAMGNDGFVVPSAVGMGMGMGEGDIQQRRGSNKTASRRASGVGQVEAV